MNQNKLTARLFQLGVEIEAFESKIKTIKAEVSDPEEKLIRVEEAYLSYAKAIEEFRVLEGVMKSESVKPSKKVIESEYSDVRSLLLDSKPEEEAKEETKSCWTPCIQCITSLFLRPPNEHFCFPAGSREYICNPKSDTVGEYEGRSLDSLNIKWD